jgi:hypothetical protein
MEPGNGTDVRNAYSIAYNSISHDKDYLAVVGAGVSGESPQDHDDRSGQKDGLENDLQEGVCTITVGTRDGCRL